MIPFGDIGSHIEAVLGGPMTGLRFAAGSRVEGDWVSGASSPLSFTGSAQPSTPKEVQMIPAGERTKEAITVFSTLRLRASDVAAQTESDVVNWESRQYKVVLVDSWNVQANYCRAIAVRVHE